MSHFIRTIMLHEKKCTLQPWHYFQYNTFLNLSSLLLTKLITKLDQEGCGTLALLENENGVLYANIYGGKRIQKKNKQKKKQCRFSSGRMQA